MQRTRGRSIPWRIPSITSDGLKIFAGLIMLIQTIGITIVEKGMIHLDRYTQAELSIAMAEDPHLMVLAGVGSVMQLLGGLAVPVYAFLLVEGFMKTSNYSKYLLHILLFALISELPYDLAYGHKFVDFSSQNALFTMSICLLMLYFIKMLEKKEGFLSSAGIVIIILCAIAWVTLFRAQFGLCMVGLTAVFYLFSSHHVLKTVLGIVISLLYVTGPLSFYLLWFYNEERKETLPKYSYYLFYPLHLLILGIFAVYIL